MLTRCNPIRFAIPRLTIRTRSSPSSRVKPGNGPFRSQQRRQFGSASQSSQSAAQNGTAHSSMGPLAGLAQELDRIAPRFEVDAEDIEILTGPKEFYDCLKEKILKAKSRIYLATLYFGAQEHDLIDTIRASLRQNPDVKLEILTDALRGTREAPKRATCASLIAPLIAEFGPERVQIRMYHTPNMTGLRKKLIPKRISEGWGLQHMKLYGIDDSIMLSGANLSGDYFTNRVDRYHLIHSAELAQYYYGIHAAISGMSYDVRPAASDDKDKTAALSGFKLTWPRSNEGPPPLQQPKSFAFHASRVLTPLIRPAPAASDVLGAKPNSKTLIYPIFQLTQLLPSPQTSTRPADPTTSTEHLALTLLLSSLAVAPLSPARWTFTSGYFNMTPGTRDLLLGSVQPPGPSAGSGAIIAASPWANGFLGSKYPSNMLPSAYTYLAKKFLQEIRGAGLSSQISLLEWRRGTVNQEGGWTYHAKGIWVTLQKAKEEVQRELEGRVEEAGPCITVVGSSNYSARSYALDLESNALILTRDEELQKRLRDEETRLKEHAKEMSLGDYERSERRVSIGVRVALWFVTLVGGAL